MNQIRIVITATGHHGDVVPLIALGLALKERQYKVMFATESRWRELVDEAGLDSRLIGGDTFGVYYEPKYQETLIRGSSRSLSFMNREWEAQFDNKEIYNSYVVACSGADLIITNENSLMPSYCVSEYLQCVWIPVVYHPILSTSEFPHWSMDNFWYNSLCCGCMNKRTYRVAAKRVWNSQRNSINAWRREILGLAVLTENGGAYDVLERITSPILIASSSLVCGLFGRTPSDYRSNCHMYGFLHVPDCIFAPNSDLDAFLAINSPKKVIYLGLGALPTASPISMLRLALEICREALCRAVVVANWTGLYQDEQCLQFMMDCQQEGTMIVVKEVGHSLLFPKMACIVHHGGVGTMAAALRSGVPQIVIPSSRDQFHNAKQLVRMGVVVGVIKFNRIVAYQIALLVKAAIGAQGNNQNIDMHNILQSCQHAKERIDSEYAHSMSRYVEVIQTCLFQSKQPSTLTSNANSARVTMTDASFSADEKSNNDLSTVSMTSLKQAQSTATPGSEAPSDSISDINAGRHSLSNNPLQIMATTARVSCDPRLDDSSEGSRQNRSSLSKPLIGAFSE